MAHPVFKTGGARQTALEGSTPSPFRMSVRDLPSAERLAAAVARADPRTPPDDEAREVARAVRAVPP